MQTVTVTRMSQPKIVAFSGSSRKGSFNRSLIAIAAAAAREAGAEVKLVDLWDLSLPIFDQDTEAKGGLPDGAKRFKELLRASDGFLIASPEYNSSVAPLLKNALDWASRAETDDEPPLCAYRGKVGALFAASPGALGGLRGLVTLRSILGNIGVVVLPDQVCIPVAHEAFDETGALREERKAKSVAALAKSLVETARKLKG